ncbi:MAG: hypothetical protein P1V35_06600, partial [Planctomycetota bacterium]|nr:hypothetical protein [Planctomycetota bacterium]
MVAGMSVMGLFFGLALLVIVVRPDVIRNAWASLLDGPTSSETAQAADREAIQDPKGGQAESLNSEPIPASEMEELLLGEDLEVEPSTDEEIAAWIDNIAGHPDDISLPRGILGSSDEVLSAMNALEIKAFLEDPEVQDFLSRKQDQPRFTFAVGRAAMFGGYSTFAKGLLEEASANGSGGASAYLADPSFGASTQEAIRLYEEAIARNFAPAKNWLSELQAGEQERGGNMDPIPELVEEEENLDPTPKPKQFKYEDFQQPGIIKALHTGDLAALDQIGARNSMIYIGKLQEGLVDPSMLIHLSPEGGRRFFAMLDPTLSANVGMASISDLQIVKEQMHLTGGVLTTMLEEYSKG